MNVCTKVAINQSTSSVDISVCVCIYVYNRVGLKAAGIISQAVSLSINILGSLFFCLLWRSIKIC